MIRTEYEKHFVVLKILLVASISFFILFCIPAATLAAMDTIDGDTNCTGSDVSLTLYINQFAACFSNVQSTVNTDNPQAQCDGTYMIAVGTAPTSTNIAGWTTVACNGSTTLTFNSPMYPDTTYYITRSQQGQYENTDGFKIEKVLPTISTTEPAQAWYKTDPGATFDVSFNDATGKICKTEYSIWTQSGQTGTQIAGWTTIANSIDQASVSLNGTWSSPWASLHQGDNYFSFRTNDCATNQTTKQDAFNAGKDTVAPTHTTVAPLAYWISNTVPVIAWSGGDVQQNVNDVPSGIKCFYLKYKDLSGGGYSDAFSPACSLPAGGPNYSGSFTATEGHSYAVQVQAMDNALNTDTIDTDGTYTFMVDTQAPTASVSALPAYTTSLPFNVSWSGSDYSPGSGVAGYDVQYAVGTAGPSWNNWLVGAGATPGTTSTSSSFNLATDGNTYYFQVKAKDNAGNAGTYTPSASGVLVDQTLPTSSVAALTQYTATSTFPVSWSGSDPSVGTASGINCYDVQYSLNGGAWTLWKNCFAGTSDNFNASVSGGVGTYAFRSRAKDNAGNWEAYPATADTQTYADYTPPVISFVNDGDAADIDFSNLGTEIKANWSVSEPDSGIDHYEYAIGTSPGGTQVVNWTSNGTSTSIDVTSLTLTHKTTYYVTLRAYNRALIYSQAASDGVKTDLVAPTVSMSSPNSAYVGATSFSVAWSGADGTGESGLVNYDVQVKDVGFGSWSNWKLGTVLTNDVYSGVNGHTYQFRTIARDNAGNVTPFPVSPDYQVQTTIDTSSLSAPATISEGAESGLDIDYSHNTAQFSGHWDAVSGASAYNYAVGTLAGVSDAVGWATTTGTSFTATSLTLANGTRYYLSVRAVNFSGVAGFTGKGDGVLIDLTAPGCAVSALDPYQNVDQFSVAWGETGGPDASGIAAYDLQYKDGQTGAWTDWLTGSGLTSSLFPGNNGHKYYLQCRATDNAGNTGTYPGGDGDTNTTVDTNILPYPATRNDGTGADLEFTTDNTSLSANWSAVPGAASYVICFGNGLNPNNCNVMSFTDIGLVTSYTKSGLSLVEDETYFMRIKAKNLAGTEGVVGYTDGVTLNAQPPGTPVVTDEGAFTNNPSQLFASWTSVPGSSGIIEYQYAIGTTSGATDVANWTSAGMNNEATITGLTLSNGINYYISIKAKSGAGVWSTPGNSDGILEDTAPPVCTVGALAAYQSSLTFPVTWSSTDSGSGNANLYDVQYKDGAAGNWTVWQSFTSFANANFTGVEGHTYYFQCRALDNANNWSSYPGGGGDTSTTVNALLPAAPAVSDGAGADEDITTSGSALDANWNAVSGAASYSYAIGTTSGGTDLVSWTDTAATSFSLSALSLSNGATYYVSVKAKNNAGNFGATGTSDGIKVDTDPPTTPVVVSPDSVTSSTTFLEASWSASDPQTGISEYQVSVGSTPGGTDEKAWYSAGLNTSGVISGLTMTHGLVYYVNVKAKNGSGQWSAVGSNGGVTVNTTLIAAPATINDGAATDEDYTPATNTLSGNWTPVTDAFSYDYAIGTSFGARNIVDWTNNGTGTSFTKTGLTLVNGTTYYISVRTRNSADVPGASRSSDGSMADSAAPGTPAVADGGAYSNSTELLTASWTAVPGVSGIKEYQYAIGTTSGGTDILGWTGAGLNTSATVTGLTLAQGGPYYIAVKAISNAGLESTGIADGITVDSLTPSCAVQSLTGYQPAAGFTVTWTASDSGSGLSGGLDVQSRDGASGAWVNWLTNTGLLTSTFTAQDGHTYYFRCIAKDAAGNSTQPAQDGDTSTTYTTAVPPTASVNDGTGEDLDYQTSTDSLSANWTAVSNPDFYYYAIGTTAGGTDVLDWKEVSASTLSFTETGLSLVNNTKYYVSVKARVNTYNFSVPGISDGILVDTQPPTRPVVSRQGEFTNSLTELSASWSASDAESGIDFYEISVGTTPGSVDIKNWASVGTVTYTTVSGLQLQDGATYYINIRANDKAGLTSEVGSSDSITVDSTLLPGPATITDGSGSEDIDYASSTTTLSASWAAVSGAASYQYSIGTGAGQSNLYTWTSAGEQTAATVNGLTLVGGGTYYFNVRAVNFAGVIGAVRSSDGVTVDPTPPDKPVVSDDGITIDVGQQLHFTISAVEDFSPIVKYEYALGNDLTETNVKDWTSVGTTTNVTVTDTPLSLGKIYYISVRATNKAGLTSETGISDGIKAILEPKITLLTEDNVLIDASDPGNIKPILITIPPKDSGDFRVSKRIKFKESNGVGVKYDRIKRKYILEDGSSYEDSWETTSLEASPNSDNLTLFELFIPARVLLVALGGSADAVIILEYDYSGTDQMNSQINTSFRIPIKITTSLTEGVFEITSAAVTYPASGGKLAKGGTNTAEARINLNGVGSLSGIWLLDGQFYKAFKQDVNGETEVTARQALPATLMGEHTLQFRVTVPKVVDSDPVSFTVQDVSEAGKTISDFWLNFVNLKVTEGKFDPSTQTWSGKSTLKLPFTGEDVEVEFKRLQIRNENEKNIVTRGIIAVVLDKSIQKGALTIKLTKLFIGTDRVAADGQVTFAGTDDMPELGPFFFYDAGITQDGIQAVVKLDKPQKGKIGYFEIGINEVFFANSEAGATLKAAGYITTTPQKILTLHLYFGVTPEGTKFDYSIDERKDWILPVSGQK